MMGNVIDFPESRQLVEIREGLINSNLLVGPIHRANKLLFGKREKPNGLNYAPEIFNAPNNKVFTFENSGELEIHAPLDWIMDISDYASDYFSNKAAENFQVMALTAIYIKDKLEIKNSNKNEGSAFRLNPKTHFTFEQQKVSIDFRNAHDIKIWQMASAIALRVTTALDSPERDELMDVLDYQKEDEIEIELVNQGFSHHKNWLHKVHKKLKTKNIEDAKLFELDGFRVGCLSPMGTEQLLHTYPGFLRVANS